VKAERRALGMAFDTFWSDGVGVGWQICDICRFRHGLAGLVISRLVISGDGV
jgi:hypothetical protein